MGPVLVRLGAVRFCEVRQSIEKSNSRWIIYKVRFGSVGQGSAGLGKVRRSINESNCWWVINKVRCGRVRRGMIW